MAKKSNPFEGRSASEIKTAMFHAAAELRNIAHEIHPGATTGSRDRRLQAIQHIDAIKSGAQELSKRGDEVTFKPHEIPSAFKEHFEGTPIFPGKPQKPTSKLKQFMKRIIHM